MFTHAVKPAPKMSSTLAINAKVSELEAEGESVLQLGFGEARFPVHPKILAALKEHATARSYLSVSGLPELRKKVAEYYRRRFKINADPARVIVGSGSKSLLFAALYALEGDVLLPTPSWVSYETQAQLVGKKIHEIPTRREDNYYLSPAQLRAGLKAARQERQSPAVLVLNSPHNPTGVMYPPKLLAELAEVAREEDLIVLSDEIYALTAYGTVPHVSIARYYPEGTVVTGGLSKHLSLGGWRLGVAILPEGEFGAQLQQSMASIASSIWTTPAAPVQYAAVTAYSDDPDIDRYVHTCACIHGLVTGYLYGVLQSLGVPCAKPSGGFYLYPSFAPWREALARRHNVHTSQQLAEFLLDEEHIAILPGSDFGDDPAELTLRMSTSYLYALNDEEGEKVLATYARNLQPFDFLKQACPRVLEMGERLKVFVGSLV